MALSIRKETRIWSNKTSAQMSQYNKIETVISSYLVPRQSCINSRKQLLFQNRLDQPALLHSVIVVTQIGEPAG